MKEMIREDIYMKYSQEDGLIPFKAVKWILVGPPQVGKTTTKMRLLKQIVNIKTEIEVGNMKPDSTGIEKPVEVISATVEKPVEVICATMIPANKSETGKP